MNPAAPVLRALEASLQALTARDAQAAERASADLLVALAAADDTVRASPAVHALFAEAQRAAEAYQAALAHEVRAAGASRRAVSTYQPPRGAP